MPASYKIATAAMMILTLTGCAVAVLSPTPMPPTVTPVPPTGTPTPVAASSPTAVSQPSLPTKEKGDADSAEAIVKELVATKLEAMKAKDIQRYLALINETDKEYYTEQRNWFLIYQDAVTSDFTIEVIKAEKINDTTIVASLYQHYLYGPEKADRRVTYEERFIKTPNGWKDADLNFKAKETPHFVVKYQGEVEANAVQVCEEAEKAYVSVVKELGLEPHDKTTLKLFADQEMLRQNTDIRVAYLFNGWAEDGESIKMYARRERATIAPLTAHELTHKITLGISDSLNSWLAEGLVIYFGSRPFRGGNVLLELWTTITSWRRPPSSIALWLAP